MKAKSIAVGVVGLLAVLCIGVPGAQAQARCSLQTFTGTYAFYERGSSSIFDANSQPYPFHWAGAYAPFVTVGEVTIKPDGTGHGFYWIRVGSFNAGADPIEVNLTVTEMNADCTGKFTYQVNLPGNTEPTTVVERFILLDNGREYRSIPAAIENGITPLTWLGEGHRISKPGEPLNTCGPQTAKGRYVWAVENLVQFTPDAPIFSDALLLSMDVSMSGDYAGMLYEKLGPTGNIVLPTSGRITVNANCSYAATLNFTIQSVPVSIAIRGVFFEQGKKLYGLAVDPVQADTGGTQFSFGQGQRTNP